MGKAIAATLKAPGDPKSLETIAKHNTNSQRYVMIRGWLTQELRSAESQLGATRDHPKFKKKHQTKVDFPRKAIRRINLK